MIVNFPYEKFDPRMQYWIAENVGYRGWKEWINPFKVGHITYEFYNDEHAAMFILPFL